MILYTPSGSSGSYDLWTGVPIGQPATPSSVRTGVADAAHFGIEVENNLLACINASVGSPFYRQAFACASGRATGDPVYMTGANSVELAAASGSGTSKVVGFIREITAADTGCYLSHYWYKTGLTVALNDTVYLTNAGGIASGAGTFRHTMGIAISTTGALLRADPVSASLSPVDMGGAPVAVGTGVADSGVGTFPSRFDHVHAVAYSGAPTYVGTGSGGISGTSTTPARSDHSHMIRSGWNDLIVEVKDSATTGTVQATFDLIGGTGVVRSWRFDVNDELGFNAEMPHDYQEGTDLHPHVHWMGEAASGTAPIRFVIDFQWRESGEAYTISGTGLNSYSGSGTAGTGYIQHGMELGQVTGTSKKIGGILTGRLRRITNGATDYAGNVFVFQFGFHYQMDSLGSLNEWSKA